MPISQPHFSPKAPTLAACWQEFNRLFPNEGTCVEHIRKLLPRQSRCSTCANTPARNVYGGRFFKCQFCFKKRWLTAGTFFHRARQLRPWLAAIFLFERGVPVNALQLHRLLGIAYSTAFSILKKITAATHGALQEQATMPVPSSLFRSLFTKRSRETPARKLPLAEEDAIDEAFDEMARQRSGDLPRDQASMGALEITPEALKEAVEPIIEDPVEKAIYTSLSAKAIPYDAICEKTSFSAREVSAALTFMELSGLVKRLPGDQYVRSPAVSSATAGEQALDGAQMKVVDKIVEYIRSKFGGISRKYLQNYISIQWYQADSEQGGQRSLLDLCLKQKSVCHREIREYVSPPLVQIAAIDS
jgi:DprA winged helix domain